MRPLRILAVLCLATPLVACNPSADPRHKTNVKIPRAPEAVRKCINETNLVTIPNRDLSVAEVERLWKNDRLRFVIVKKCGQQLDQWQEQLHSRWR